ncbi:MAG TPA: lipopolysaccharide biosynthesis protein [Polyangiaceae bacterium]|nr:lipopolysaccharide biosynthesis protein [Polyangiaceae bacterium]
MLVRAAKHSQLARPVKPLCALLGDLRADRQLPPASTPRIVARWACICDKPLVPPEPESPAGNPARPAPPDPASSPAATPATPATLAAAPDVARTAGRGGLAIAAAKVSFIVFGFVQQLLLPLLIGVDGYGAVAVVFAAVSVVNNVIVATGIQGVSRAVSSAAPERAEIVFRKTLLIHVGLAMIVSAAFAASAGLIAAFVKAPHIEEPLRISAAVVLLYGIYAPLVGALNGRRRFLEQAAFDVGYGALRTGAIAAFALVFIRLNKSGVLGVIVGFVAAAAIIVPVALGRIGTGKSGDVPAPRPLDHIAFLLPLILGQASLSLLLQTDLFLLRRFIGDAAGAGPDGVKTADELIAVYRGAQLFAFLPYQILMSITFILFPMLARARVENDAAAIRSYTRTGIRLGLLITGLMCGAVSALAPHVLHLAFPEKIWANGGDTLRLLSLGLGAFAILGITCAALTSLGREREAAALTGSTVGFVALACKLFVPQAELGPPMLIATAAATSCAVTCACLIGAVRLARVAGGFVAPLTLGRVLVALAVAVAVGSRVPWMGRVVVPVQAMLVGGIYLAILVVLREIGKEDLNLVRRVLGMRS